MNKNQNNTAAARRYKKLREARGTQAQVAKALGVTGVTLCARENGRVAIKPEAFAALEQLGVQPKGNRALTRYRMTRKRLDRIVALVELSPTELRVIKARSGLHGPKATCAELAAELGVTKERVRQIEAEVLKKARAA